jgi:hypothetical protein
MQFHQRGLLPLSCAAFALGVAVAAPAVDAPGFHSSPSVRPIVTAIDRGDCDGAVTVANDAVLSDADVAFLVGRMINEGICTRKDSSAAAAYFEHALMLGATGSALDWAVKIGLGEGVQQSYERAGEVCRTGGVDPQARMSRYSLGYACTLSGLTAELLRTTLPRGALQSGTALVEFTPSSGVMEIRNTPRVAISEADTGSRVHPPAVDAAREINQAWLKAIARAPKPDATILDKLAVELPVDLDTTLEAAATRVPGRGGILQLGQEYPGGKHPF